MFIIPSNKDIELFLNLGYFLRGFCHLRSKIAPGRYQSISDCKNIFVVYCSVYSEGEKLGDFHPISATKTVLLSFNTVFSYNQMGGKDRRRQNMEGGNSPPIPPIWGGRINTDDDDGDLSREVLQNFV